LEKGDAAGNKLCRELRQVVPAGILRIENGIKSQVELI
jgi:hypothetical protein